MGSGTNNEKVTRRNFIGGSGVLAGSSLLRLGAPVSLALIETACSARDSAAAFNILSPSEGRELDAITARILPTTDTPGAREAGVVYFFDAVLGDQFAGQLGGFRFLLGGFLGGIEARFPGAKMYSDLSEADQDAYLAEQGETPFFGMVQAFTMMGFFAMSSYGGNKDNVGWKLIGFPGHGATQPPFGYYDAQYMQGERDDN